MPDNEGMTWTEDLSGRLLVASPDISEGIFRRSVILVLHHDEDGAQGLILNRPLEAEIDAVLPGWGSIASQPPQVFHGGPVGLDCALGIVALGGGPVSTEGLRRLFGGLGLVDLDSEPAHIGPAVGGMRVFAGYAGWVAGQLESEIASGSWYVVDCEPGDAFVREAGVLWRTVLRRQTNSLALVATYPADPSLN